jgi:hypothetical protein
MKQFSLDGVIFVAISNLKPLTDFYMNHVTFDSLDMDSLYEVAKLNMIEYKKSESSVFKFNLIHSFTTFANEKILEGISKESTYAKYLNFGVDNVWKVCHKCDMSNISGHRYMLQNLLHTYDVKKYNTIEKEISEANIVSNIEEREEAFLKLQNIVTSTYPVVVTNRKYIPTYRFEETDFIESIIGYINMVDSKEVI